MTGAERRAAAAAVDRELWARIFSESAVPTSVVLDGRFRWVNEAFADLHGIASEALIGQPFAAVTAEIDPAQLARVYRERRAGARSTQLAGHLVRPDGRRLWVRIEATQLEGPDPAPAVVQVVDLTDLEDARRTVTAAERRLRRLLGNIRDNITVTDASGRILYSTGGAKRALGYDTVEWEHLDLLSLVHADDVSTSLARWEEALRRPGREVSTELRIRSTDHQWNDVAVTYVNRIDDPAIGGMVVTTRNVSDLRRTQRLAQGQNEILELIARGAPLGDTLQACVRLIDRNVKAENTSAISLAVEGRHQMRASSMPAVVVDWFGAPGRRTRTITDDAFETGREMVEPDVFANDHDPERRALAEEVGVRAGWCVPTLSASGEPVGVITVFFAVPHEPTLHDRQVVELASSLVSIAMERAADEQRLTHHALHDELTGLPNRTLLGDRLNHALARRDRSGSGVGVLFCDLDRFKVVNDSLGHGAGDELLVAFARRLEAVVEPGDTLARFGGDEFVVLLEEMDDEHQSVAVAQRIAEALQEPFEIAGGQEVHLTASTGITTSTEHGQASAWLRDADAAMYQAKAHGRNRFEMFNTAMREAAIARLDIQTDLRNAIRVGDLVVHYQPIVDLRTGHITGAEALVRWHHARRGLVPPLEFIPVAEDTGLIHELGAKVLDEAVREMAGVCGRLGRPLDLSVNLSAKQLTNLGLGQDIDQICERWGWPGDRLLLEITESAIADGVHSSLELLGSIRERGIEFAIDDFGTGHSSLDRLGRMPVDQVKIDRSFVNAIDHTDQRMVRIVDAVVGIAEALELSTCAEGVESGAQLAYLRSVGCELAQGYFFARPLPIDEFESVVASDPTW